VTLLSAWALAGLLLAVPLVLLHLRRNRPPVRDVASLLSWRALPGQASSPSKRLGRPLLPLLLLLQLLALVLIVLGLARPAGGAGLERASRIYVVDESIWMQAREHGITRLASAQSLLRGQIARLPADLSVRIVAAAATPSVLFSGTAHDATRAVGGLRATQGVADLQAGLALAAGLRRNPGDRIELVRSPQDAPPVVQARRSTFTQVLVGGALDDQGLSDAVARCGLPASGESSCEVFARVLNSGPSGREDRVQALERGRPVSAQTVAVAAGSSSPVAFLAPAGAAVQLQLPGHDALAADDRAYVAVPAQAPVRITVVGNPAQARPLVRALESVPDVELRLRTPGSYRVTDPGTSDLLVLDGWLPPGGLPPAPGLLLVAPPRLPDGRVQGALSNSRLSGSDPTSGLLEGADLTSLTIYSGQARRLTLPSWMAAVAWSPEGPLLAAGSRGGQRVEVLAFEPSGSDLPQLAAFPVLVANLVGSSQQWAPLQVTAGQPAIVQEPPGTTSASLTAGDRPALSLPVGSGAPHALAIAQAGLVSIRQRGPWGTRSRTIAVNVQLAPSQSPSTPIDLAAAVAAVRTPRTAWWPWALAGALLVLLLATAYEARHELLAASV
jgi:Ca-activated chloride channel homolog